MRTLRLVGRKVKNDIVGHRYVSDAIRVTVIKEKVTELIEVVQARMIKSENLRQL